MNIIRKLLSISIRNLSYHSYPRSLKLLLLRLLLPSPSKFYFPLANRTRHFSTRLERGESILSVGKYLSKAAGLRSGRVLERILIDVLLYVYVRIEL